MRGEYKVPGGKLVAVDVEVEEGRLARVAVSGDFFLEPDDALEDIDGALTGMPETATVSQLANAVQAALAPDVTMVGFSPEAVAIAVRRALGRATGWGDHTFEIVHEGPEEPAMHLALDQVLTEELDEGRRGPTLRIWEWASPAVIIGSFQSLRNEVDPEGAERHGFDVVRRISGGGAMMMAANSIVTYSLYVPASLVAGMTFADSYAFLDDWVLQALRSLGIEATYQPLNDIASPQGKIGGAAQKRLANGGVLHHATLSYDMDGQVMTEVLRIGREKLSDKGTVSAAKRVDPLRRQTGLSREAIIERFKDTFRSLTHAETGSISADEYADAEALVESKFATDAWLRRVP